MATWRVGRRLGRTLYKDGRLVGLLDSPELAAEIVTALNEREVRPPTRYTVVRPPSSAPPTLSLPPPPPGHAPKTVPGMAAVRPEPLVKRKTSSGLSEALIAHYKNVIDEETGAITVAEELVRSLRDHSDVARYIEATVALEAAVRRRENAARDLGLVVAGERPIAT